jgi:hypothetical protein
MQTRGDRTAGVTGDQRPDRITGAQPLAGDDRRRHRLVRGAQAIGVVDAHDAAPGQLTGEPDHAGAGAVHRRPWLRGQVDTAVAGQPRQRRRLEPACHRRLPVQGPAEPPRGRVGRGQRRRIRARPHPGYGPDHHGRGGDRRNGSPHPPTARGRRIEGVIDGVIDTHGLNGDGHAGSLDRTVGDGQGPKPRLWTARVAVDGQARIGWICYGRAGGAGRGDLPISRRSRCRAARCPASRALPR